MTLLPTHAIEQSTYAIVASFHDENGDPVEPNDDLVWTLTDPQGNVINERERVPVASATSVTIVLHGDDLALLGGSFRRRVLTIEGTFNSDLGTDLELKQEVQFDIADLVAVPGAPVVP